MDDDGRGHTTATMQALVDAYYNLGALINLYCHSTSDGSGMDGSLPGDMLTYSLSKPRIWSTNSAGIYDWWLQQSNAQVAVDYTNDSGRSVTTLSISGEGNTNAAVEVLAPSASYSAPPGFHQWHIGGCECLSDQRPGHQGARRDLGFQRGHQLFDFSDCAGRCFHCAARLSPGCPGPGCFNQRHGGQWRGQSDSDAGEWDQRMVH